MQRRLRDPSAAKKLQCIRATHAAPLPSEQNEDADNILSFELDDDHPRHSHSEECLALNDETDEDLLEYESEWEDLFTDSAVAQCPSDEEMLDCLHIALQDDDDEIMFSGDLEDDISLALEEMLEL